MRRIRRLVGLAIVLTFAAACSSEAPPENTAEQAPAAQEPVNQGLAAIEAGRIKMHLEFLAADARKGRMTGTPEYDEAADYVARQFEAIGLVPGGEDGGWFQPVPMLANRIDVESATVVFHQEDEEQVQRFRDDFVMGGDAVRPETEIRAEVVFVGFGIHAPDMNYSDFDGIDVDGKIIARFGGAPGTFPHNERAYYSSGVVKAREAVARGAIGVIAMRSRTDQERYTWKFVSENAGVRPGMTWINLSGEAANYFPEMQGGALVNEPPAEDLFSRAPISYEDALDAADAGKPLSTPLGVEVTLARKTDHETIASPNVVGILRGSDPELADEYVIYTAHLDHIGTGVPVNGDTIYNGMYDNAMGSSILIETARAFAAMPEPPKRSIIFIALTGEERGLVGSEYFANYPTVPSDAIVANVNLDMPLLLFPLSDIIAFGAEHSSLEQVIEKAIAREGFTLTPDPMPEEVIFIRSDQYSFVKQGVPAAFLVPGFTAAEPGIEGEKLWREFLQTHYHQPSDDLTRPVDWASAVRFARANVRIGYAVAEDEERPSWNEGDFFAEKFGSR
ncbi:MAG TPA: M28 family metallopeptidase [Woeseiaceae bacterium]|nr:M28 family metallopeptidase [Woeseiaceae bacterium]